MFRKDQGGQGGQNVSKWKRRSQGGQCSQNLVGGRGVAGPASILLSLRVGWGTLGGVQMVQGHDLKCDLECCMGDRWKRGKDRSKETCQRATVTSQLRAFP